MTTGFGIIFLPSSSIFVDNSCNLVYQPNRNSLLLHFFRVEVVGFMLYFHYEIDLLWVDCYDFISLNCNFNYCFDLNSYLELSSNSILWFGLTLIVKPDLGYTISARLVWLFSYWCTGPWMISRDLILLIYSSCSSRMNFFQRHVLRKFILRLGFGEIVIVESWYLILLWSVSSTLSNVFSEFFTYSILSHPWFYFTCF